jgi:CRP-like cAMP-binding protein
MENRLLTALGASELALLAPHFKQVPLLHGAILHEPDSPSESIYFPLGGSVSLFVVMKAGEAVEVASVGREGAVGLSAHAHTKAIVQVPGFANAIPSRVLRAVKSQSEHIRDLMIRYKRTLSAQCQQIAACNALHTVEQRLARALLHMSDRIDTTELPVTQDILAQMLGVRRTTVTLVAQTLQRRGLIHCRRGRLSILKRDAVHEIACECYDALRQADALFS